MSDKSDTSPHSFLRALALVIVPALILWIASFIYTTLDNKRKDKLEFVRGQIVELYGPLYTLSAASQSVWDNLAKKHEINFEEGIPGDEAIFRWRTVLRSVVEPLHDQMEKVLLSSKQVIHCPYARDKLHELVDFTELMRLIIETWSTDGQYKKNKKEDNMPELSYPKELPDLLSRELAALHEREKELDNGFSGLFVWHDVPDCAPEPPAPAK